LDARFVVDGLNHGCDRNLGLAASHRRLIFFSQIQMAQRATANQPAGLHFFFVSG
jgi:hypothetical protein